MPSRRLRATTPVRLMDELEQFSSKILYASIGQGQDQIIASNLLQEGKTGYAERLRSHDSDPTERVAACRV